MGTIDPQVVAMIGDRCLDKKSAVRTEAISVLGILYRVSLEYGSYVGTISA